MTHRPEYISMNAMESLNFLKSDQVQEIAKHYGTPVFVYDATLLGQRAKMMLDFSAPFGTTIRYAMKANPNQHILMLFYELGIEIDASSGYEAQRALLAGINPQKILLTSQGIPKDLTMLIGRGVQFNACSLRQLEEYGKKFPGKEVSIRINPGLGSGHSQKTNVGGPASSFGIWHEHINEAKKLATKYKLTINRIHTHIGSGTDPKIWIKVAKMSLEQVKNFPDVKILNLGGGFKVGRMKNEKSTSIKDISTVINKEISDFYKQTGRKIKLELEPGTFLVANAGSLITTVDDIVNTGVKGYTFIKIDSGMTEILRPGLYGAQHPMVVIGKNKDIHKEYVVVGHCCESGDLLTPAPGEPETLSERPLLRANIGDLLVVEGVGAYCASMSAHNYNSFPRCTQLLLKRDGSLVQVARKETLDDMLRLEI